MSQTGARWMQGNLLADQILAACRIRAAKLRRTKGIIPGFAVVLVGGDELAVRYLERKRRACTDLGLRPIIRHLESGTTSTELAQALADLGRDESVHGILLQYPLPAHIDERRAFDVIPPAKDVDSTTTANLARLSEGKSPQWPCVVEAAQRLLHYYGVSIAGRSALVIGSHHLIAQPTGEMLMSLGAHVSHHDGETPELSARVAQCDVIATAIGQPKFLKAEWFKPGAIVIDTGLNPGPSGPIGDVDPAAIERVSYLTPVPGGLGKLTLALLVERTIHVAAETSPP
jgi:methylenetetrahydrofolate dehydrogenase (NADP+)/methenyltetrahydrofolate cyclohydrolase